MSSKTKIIVLHMREIIYTVVFAVLALILILLLFFMFGPKRKKKNFRPAYRRELILLPSL